MKERKKPIVQNWKYQLKLKFMFIIYFKLFDLISNTNIDIIYKNWIICTLKKKLKIRINLLLSNPILTKLEINKEVFFINNSSFFMY